jgi:hypothetical protein
MRRRCGLPTTPALVMRRRLQNQGVMKEIDKRDSH